METFCSVENCKRAKKTRGMCKPCYEKWRKANRDQVNTTRNNRWFNPDGSRMKCHARGCVEDVETVGMCRRHYHQFNYEATRGLEVGRKNRKRRTFEGESLDLRCTFEGCDKAEFNPGLCAGHYYQRHRGEDLTPLRQKAPCQLPGCSGEYGVKFSTTRLCRRCSDTARRFSLSPEALIHLFMDPKCQNPGCGETENLHIDHDHSCCPRGKSGPSSCGQCVRGLLCRECNLTLGQLRESPRRIRGLADYLERFTQ